MAVSVLAFLLLGAALVAAAPSSTFKNVCNDKGLPDMKLVNDLVDTIIDSKFVLASDVSFRGHCSCAGIATLSSPNIIARAFNKPVVVLSTGIASNAIKDKNTGVHDVSYFPKGTKSPGDIDISNMVGIAHPNVDEIIVKDACGISFGISIPKSVTKTFKLSFPFVFASEEYNIYVGKDKGDMFGFFLGGEGNGLNVATISAGVNGSGMPMRQPVTIDTINKDKNSMLFTSNIVETIVVTEDGDDVLEKAGNLTTWFDGFTSLLNTVPFDVNGGDKLKFKIIIADVGDNRMDSAVFINGGMNICGDGVVNGNEDCDDGNLENYDGCNNWCRFSKCVKNSTHVCGDPHIESFDGANFMFTGWPDATWNMLSHPSYQLNTNFRKYRMQDGTKTWIGAVGLKVGLGSSSDTVEVTGTGKGMLSVKLNGNAVSLNHRAESASGLVVVQFTSNAEGDLEITIQTPDMTIVVTMDAFNWNLDFDIKKISMTMGDMHGVLGQSYKRMIAQRKAVSAGDEPARAVEGVEGVEADYQVKDGLFGNDFIFNKYVGESASPTSRTVKVSSSSHITRKLSALTAVSGGMKQ